MLKIEHPPGDGSGPVTSSFEASTGRRRGVGDVEVTGSRLQGVDRLGVVEASSSGTFEVTEDDFEGGQVELWIWDARTGERLGLYRVRSFPGGVGRVVVDSR